MTITKRESFDEHAVSTLVHTHVVGAEILSNIAGEISFRLPIKASPNFPNLFDEFDAQQDKLGIDGKRVCVLV